MKIFIGFVLGFIVATLGVDRSIELAKDGVNAAQTEIKKLDK
jgi:hypothetical protein